MYLLENFLLKVVLLFLVVWTFQFYPNSSKLLCESRTVGTVKGAGGWSPSTDFTRDVNHTSIGGRGAHYAHQITTPPPPPRIFQSSYGPRKRKRGVKGQYFLDILPLERLSYMPSDFLKASDLGKKCLGCFDEFCLGKKLESVSLKSSDKQKLVLPFWPKCTVEFCI